MGLTFAETLISTSSSEPGVKLVTLKNYKMSPKDHPSRPYIEFTFETCSDDKSVNSSRLYRTLPTDTPEVRGYMNKGIKELLTNAGANWEEKGEVVIKSAIGNKVKALFKQEEYVGKDKNMNNMPVIRTNIKYSFSGHPDKELAGNQSYMFKKLKPADMMKFEAEMKKWERDNPTQAAALEPSTAGSVDAPETDTPADDSDDLPFSQSSS